MMGCTVVLEHNNAAFADMPAWTPTLFQVGYVLQGMAEQLPCSCSLRQVVDARWARRQQGQQCMSRSRQHNTPTVAKSIVKPYFKVDAVVTPAQGCSVCAGPLSPRNQLFFSMFSSAPICMCPQAAPASDFPHICWPQVIVILCAEKMGVCRGQQQVSR
jgi:hypothetical protein